MVIERYYSAYNINSKGAGYWSCPYHQHGSHSFELHYFLGGVGTFLMGDRSIAIKKNLLIICPPDTYHQVKASHIHNPVSYFAVIFSAKNDDELYELFSKNPFLCKAPIQLDKDYRVLFEEVRENIFSGREMGLKISAHKIFAFLYEVCDRKEIRILPVSKNPVIVKADEYMRANLSHKLKNRDVAGFLDLSEEHFVRLFSKEMGIPPIHYYTILRLNRGEELLTTKELSIKEIAKRCGFSDQFVFSKSFKRYKGVAPQNLRSIQRKKAQDVSCIENDSIRIDL